MIFHFFIRKEFHFLYYIINLVKEIIRVLNTKRRDSYRIKVLIFIHSFGKKHTTCIIFKLSLNCFSP